MVIEYYDEFVCLSCEGEPEFKSRAEAIAHIKEVHEGDTKAHKNLVVHLDYDRGQYESDYEWQFEKFKMLERVGRGDRTVSYNHH